MSLSLQNIKAGIKNQDGPFFRILFQIYSRARKIRIWYPVWLSGLLFHERRVRLSLWHNLLRIFYYEPMFRYRCKNVGNNLTLLGGLPYISTGLQISIGHNCVVYGVSNFELVDIRNSGELIIGNNTTIGHRNVISVAQRIEIGNNVILSPEVRIRDNDGHPLDPVSRRKNATLHPATVRPVVIEDDVWIGAFTLVNKGVRIGRCSVIGAGSVVTTDIPSFSVAVGNPARVVRMIEASEI